MSRDISYDGVYLYLEHPLAVGLWVEFDIEFPPERPERRNCTSTRFRCKAQIVRTERLAERFGIVAAIRGRELIGDSTLGRRGYVRIVPNQPLRVDQPLMFAVVRDINRVGAFIETESPLRVGQKIEIWLTGLSQNLHILAVVRRVEPAAGVGIEFVALKSESDQILKKFLRA